MENPINNQVLNLWKAIKERYGDRPQYKDIESHLEKVSKYLHEMDLEEVNEDNPE